MMTLRRRGRSAIVDEIRAQSDDRELENVFEAKDDHGKIIATFRCLKYWIHVDPVLRAVLRAEREDEDSPVFDFRLTFVSPS